MSTVRTQLLSIRWASEAFIALGLVGLTAAAARLTIPLPFTPVPATLQVGAVIFAGAAFGSRRGALSQLLYLLAGCAGLPVFAAAAAAPTFGYLLAFPLAAYLAGRFTRSGAGRWLGAFAGLAVIYALGSAWLALWAAASGTPFSAAWVWTAGVGPFLLLDLFKTSLAVFSARPIQRRWLAS